MFGLPSAKVMRDGRPRTKFSKGEAVPVSAVPLASKKVFAGRAPPLRKRKAGKKLGTSVLSTAKLLPKLMPGPGSVAFGSPKRTLRREKLKRASLVVAPLRRRV